MASLSIYLFVLGGVALFVAFMLDVIHTTSLAVGRRTVATAALPGGGQTQAGTVTVSTGSGPLSYRTDTQAGSIGHAFTWIAFLAFVGSLAIRAYLVGRGPWGNMFEFTWRSRPGSLAATCIWPGATPSAPSRSCPWVWRCSSSATRRPSPRPSSRSCPRSPTRRCSPSTWRWPIIELRHLRGQLRGRGGLPGPGRAATGSRGCPTHKVLDEVAYRAVIIGFPIFAALIILGSYWASIAWGRYWGWDPKETSALVTWLIYAVYLHARSLRGWAGRPAALILVIGFGAVLFTYFGNLYFSGLHAYSGL